ncbi:MAG: recombination mediator RecR [bacterium]|nr:recombination mediator RecR [bacterium]
MFYPVSVKKIIDNLKLLPGIGEKSAERLAFSMLNFDKDNLTNFSDAILELRDKICKCSNCFNISDGDKCIICSDNKRDKSQIMVVETAKDVVSFEKLGVYSGTYHVLGGLISPIDGINPEDVTIKELIVRLKNNNITEVILALKPSIEGETTMQYINKLLHNCSVKISRIASGIPVGADMEYIDALTLELALEERKNIS